MKTSFKYIVNTLIFLVFWALLFLPSMKYSIDYEAMSIAAIGGVVGIFISYRLVKRINKSNLWVGLFNESEEINEVLERKKVEVKEEKIVRKSYSDNVGIILLTIGVVFICLTFFLPTFEEGEKKIEQEIDPRENSDIFSTKSLIELGVDCQVFLKKDKDGLKGNCRLKYTSNGVSYIFTLYAGTRNHFDITKHDFYKKYKNNIKVKLYDWDGFEINGPDIQFSDMQLVHDNSYGSNILVLRTTGLMKMSKTDYYRIAGPFGDLEFY